MKKDKSAVKKGGSTVKKGESTVNQAMIKKTLSGLTKEVDVIVRKILAAHTDFGLGKEGRATINTIGRSIVEKGEHFSTDLLTKMLDRGNSQAVRFSQQLQEGCGCLIPPLTPREALIYRLGDLMTTMTCCGLEMKEAKALMNLKPSMKEAGKMTTDQLWSPIGKAHVWKVLQPMVEDRGRKLLKQVESARTAIQGRQELTDEGINAVCTIMGQLIALVDLVALVVFDVQLRDEVKV